MADDTALATVPVEDGQAKPDTLAGMWRLADGAVKSGLFPVKTAAEAFAIMQRGAELGFQGYSAFEVLYPVNGKARLTPQGAKGLALRSGLVEDFSELLLGDKDDRTAIVTVKRRGVPTPVERRFSILDAKRAKLEAKDNWRNYPDRMLLARARGFAFQDAFPDLCGGLQVRERFDLDPGEAIETRPEVVARPKTGVDPLLVGLGVKEAEMVSHADAEVRDPFPSHAEADRAISESEKTR